MPNLPQGWFSEHDISAYRELVEKIPNSGVLVEMGVWKGKSLCSVSDILIRKNIQVIAIDTFQGSVNEPEHIKEAQEINIQETFEENISNYGLRYNTKIIAGDCNSIATVKEVDTFLKVLNKSKIDLLFVDAEHTYEAVISTIDTWYKTTNVISGHDYLEWPEVKRAVDERLKEATTSLNNSDVWFYVKQTISVIVPTWQGLERVEPLIKSIHENTSIDIEVIIVNNHPTNVIPEESFIEYSGSCIDVKVIKRSHIKGFGIASNAGAEEATGNYLIFLNDDCAILNFSAKNEWLTRLIEPLQNLKVGATGVLTNSLDGFDFLVGFCLATTAGLFSEYKFSINGWGGFEDAEYSFRLECAGYQVLNVNKDNTYPIYHEAEGTLHDKDHKEVWQTTEYKENYKKFTDRLQRIIYIITPCTRVENLTTIANSIETAFKSFPRATPVWIIVPNNGAVVPESFLQKYSFASSYVYGKNSPYGNAARRHGLEVVANLVKDNKEALPEYVYFQDDDNTFSVDVVKATYATNEEVILISQYSIFNELKCNANVPIVQGEIDTAMIIASAKAAIKVGWASDAYEADTAYAKALTENNKYVYINNKLRSTYNNLTFDNNKAVTAVIPTKDRYSTTFALTLQAVITQTIAPKEILIYDDSDNTTDIREWESYKFLLILANQRGIKWELIYAPKIGVWASHQNSIMKASCPIIWRVDDDCIPEADVLETLLSHMADGVSAVAGSVLMVDNQTFNCPDNFTNKLDTLTVAPNAQWFKRTNVVEADHLYSSFIYKKRDAMDFEFPPLSKVSFREETMLSLHLSRKGKLLLVPATTWHSMASNGVRSAGNKKEMFEADELEFKRFLKINDFKQPNCKVFYAVNGKGDAEILRSVVDEFALTGTPIICAADNNIEVFEDYMVLNANQASFMGFGNIGDFNIYNFLNGRNWKKTLKEAYETFFV